MKTIRTIGLALAAVFMCVTFTACDDDDDEPAAEGKSKKLVEMKIDCANYIWSEEVECYNTTKHYKFKYDDKNRLVSCVEIYKGEYRPTDTTTYTFRWDGDVVTCESNGEVEYVFSLENGLVKPDPNSGHYLEYNSNNKLVKEIADYGEGPEALVYVWDKDRVSKILWEEDMVSDTIGLGIYLTYSGKTCKGYLPYISEVSDLFDNPLYFASPELFGIKFTSLPSKFEVEGDAFNYSSYKFDKDGYVESYAVAIEDEFDFTITLKWE